MINLIQRTLSPRLSKNAERIVVDYFKSSYLRKWSLTDVVSAKERTLCDESDFLIISAYVKDYAHNNRLKYVVDHEVVFKFQDGSVKRFSVYDDYGEGKSVDLKEYIYSKTYDFSYERWNMSLVAFAVARVEKTVNTATDELFVTETLVTIEARLIKKAKFDLYQMACRYQNNRIDTAIKRVESLL